MLRPRDIYRNVLLPTGAVFLLTCLWAGIWNGPLAPWILILVVVAVAVGSITAFSTRAHRAPFSVGRKAAVLLIAVLCRLFLMGAGHDLSDDAARYHWDGKVLASGLNPYLYAPDDPKLANLRTDELDDAINHPDVRTVYPPLAELLFSLGYRLSPGSLLGIRALYLLSEIITWLLLGRWISRRAKSWTSILYVAWCPLLVLEGYLPGHVDLLGLPFLILFLEATLKGRPVGAGLFLGLACLIKPLPLVFLPAALVALGVRRSSKLLAALLVTCALFYAPFLSAGMAVFDSMFLMAREWSFNGSIAALLEGALPRTTARWLSAFLMVLLVFISAAYGRSDLVGRMLMAAAAVVAFSPAVFPWYLAWFVPLLALRPDPALMALLALAPLSEVGMISYFDHGVWDPPLWPAWVEYSAFYFFLLLGLLKGWGMFRKTSEALAPST